MGPLQVYRWFIIPSETKQLYQECSFFFSFNSHNWLFTDKNKFKLDIISIITLKKNPSNQTLQFSSKFWKFCILVILGAVPLVSCYAVLIWTTICICKLPWFCRNLGYSNYDLYWLTLEMSSPSMGTSVQSLWGWWDKMQICRKKLNCVCTDPDKIIVRPPVLWNFQQIMQTWDFSYRTSNTLRKEHTDRF